MKWIVFASAVLAILPLSQWLRHNPKHALKLWTIFGAMPYVFNPHISPIEWPLWPGYVYGLQITGVDLFALAILPTLPRVQHVTPFRFAMGLYFLAVILSIFQAQAPMAAVFYAWQVARVLFVYFVVMRACSDGRVVRSILTGLSIGLCWQVLLAIWQRFSGGVLQAGGSFGDQNLLGLASEFAIFPPFALLLAERWSWQTVTAPLAGITVAVLTTSRAAVGLSSLGLAFVFIFSSARRWTSRKASVFFFIAIVGCSLTPLALNSFEKRFAQNAGATEIDERALFEDAASMIFSDHPLGIGANNYVVRANTGGYTEKANIPWGGDQRASIVHNAYWLTAVETGYIGLFAFALLLFQIITTAFRCWWRFPKDWRSDLLLGLGTSLLIVSIHNKFEWVFFLYNVQYLFAMSAGLVAGLALQLGYWGPMKRLEPLSPPARSELRPSTF